MPHDDLRNDRNPACASWAPTISAMSRAGYRVIALDQIGFCKSTKPNAYQYSLSQLAANTHQLWASLDVHKPVLFAHSTAGMLAIRYALSAIELATGKTHWQVPMGSIKDAPMNGVTPSVEIPLSMPTMGGPLSREGGGWRSSMVHLTATYGHWTAELGKSCGRDVFPLAAKVRQ